jgi:short-subunit dehydrogenase
MNVVITGASRGIGRAIAEEFALNGHHLFLTSRSETSLYQAMQELVTAFPDIRIKAKPFDLSIKQQAKDFAAWLLGFGLKIDVLVNNAGSFEPGNVSDEEDGVLERQIETNLYSAYHLTRAILPKMIEQQSGHIFNMCSIASLAAYPNGGAYSISKFALYGFSKNLRVELKDHGIRVTAVMPGAVMTDSWVGFDNSSKRIMETKDIARLVYTTSQLSPEACVEEIIVRPQLGDL